MATGDPAELIEGFEDQAIACFDLLVTEHEVHLTEAARFQIRDAQREASKDGEERRDESRALAACLIMLEELHGVRLDPAASKVLKSTLRQANKDGARFKHEKKTTRPPKPRSRKTLDG